MKAWWSPFSPNCEEKSLKFGSKTCSLNASNSSSLHNLNHLYLLSATFLRWNKSLFLQTLMERQTSATSKDAPKCSLYVKLGQEHDKEFPWGFRKRKRHARKQKVVFNQSILGYWRHETAGTLTSFLHLQHSHWFQCHRTNPKHSHVNFFISYFILETVFYSVKKIVDVIFYSLMKTF